MNEGKVVSSYLASAGPKRAPNVIEGKWGLKYFAMFDVPREVGFHWNIAQKRVKKNGKLTRERTVLNVNGSLISHGCVRLLDADAKDLFNRVSIGTPVTLVDTFGSTGAKQDTAPKTIQGSRSYTVAAGDTLSGIAARFKVSDKALIKANPGKIHGPKKVIRAGDTLVIPAP